MVFLLLRAKVGPRPFRAPSARSTRCSCRQTLARLVVALGSSRFPRRDEVATAIKAAVAALSQPRLSNDCRCCDTGLRGLRAALTTVVVQRRRVRGLDHHCCEPAALSCLESAPIGVLAPERKEAAASSWSRRWRGPVHYDSGRALPALLVETVQHKWDQQRGFLQQ